MTGPVQILLPLLAIDPGTKQSAWVLHDGATIMECGMEENHALRSRLSTVLRPQALHLAIEKMVSYGKGVGWEVFETCIWIGRFIEALQCPLSSPVTLVSRKQVTREICGSNTAGDPGVRAALIDRYGGKEVAIGKKDSKGPLYYVKKDIWSALAIAETTIEYDRRGELHLLQQMT